VNADSIYGYQVTNVESQTRNTSSLLHWTRRMIGLRKANPAFGLGSFTDLGGSNPAVLSFLRSYGDDIVLSVNNLSRFPQAVELDLRRWEGAEPIELTGGSRFPAIGELPYLLTIAGHGFYWLRIPAHQVVGGSGLPASERRPSAEEAEVASAEQAVRVDETARPVTDETAGNEGVPHEG